MLDDLEKNLDGYAGSVQKVIKEAKRGALRGIHGTLSQLITAPSEYAVAVETALGAAIQNVVTDDENTAKRAINFLKDNRAGRATFLPVTSVKGNRLAERGLEDCGGFVSLAVDLVGFQQELGNQNGGQNADGKTSTANFISGMMKSVPPLDEVFSLAGMQLPSILGKKAETEEALQVLMRSMLALMTHSIDGNHTDELEKARDDMHDYLIKRR